MKPFCALKESPGMKDFVRELQVKFVIWVTSKGGVHAKGSIKLCLCF